MPEHTDVNEHISLTQGSKHAPGRPSTNCMWRWCRRGVLGRNGARVYLKHIRAGGKIFTTIAWIEEFGRGLAQADAEYFSAKDEAAKRLPPRDPRYGPPAPRGAERGSKAIPPGADLDAISRELEAEGI